jgi:hypothetical protein
MRRVATLNEIHMSQPPAGIGMDVGSTLAASIPPASDRSGLASGPRQTILEQADHGVITGAIPPGGSVTRTPVQVPLYLTVEAEPMMVIKWSVAYFCRALTVAESKRSQPARTSVPYRIHEPDGRVAGVCGTP